MPKIFVLSLHRSGTQSIHHLFLQAGLNSIHQVSLVVDGLDLAPKISGREQDLEFIAEALDPIFSKVEAASDLPVMVLYRELERLHPEALFVAVRRKPEDWVRSVRANLVDSVLPLDVRILYYQYLPARPTRLSDVSDEELIGMHREHHKRIADHFKGKPNFAMFELEDPQLGERICTFLGLPPIKFPYVDSGPIVLAMAQLRTSRSRLFRQLCIQIVRKAFGAPDRRTHCPGELPEVIAEYDAFRNSPSRLFRQLWSELLRRAGLTLSAHGGFFPPSVLSKASRPVMAARPAMRRLVAIALLCLALGAAGEKLGAEPLIRKLDVDHDGMISREELRTATGRPLHYLVCKFFKAVDTNHDGKLDKDELSRSGESLFWFLLGRSEANKSPT